MIGVEGVVIDGYEVLGFKLQPYGIDYSRRLREIDRGYRSAGQAEVLLPPEPWSLEDYSSVHFLCVRTSSTAHPRNALH